MESACRIDRHGHGFGAWKAGILAAMILALLLLFAPPSLASTDNSGEATFEARAAAEKASRSRYRKLEVASLIIIFAAGAGAVYWAVRRRKPE